VPATSRAREVSDDRGVGRERECGRRPKGKVSNLIEVVSRFEDSADRASMKPDSDRLVRSVVKVGMNRTDAADLDKETGLFLHLPARRLPDVLTPVDVAAGNAPPPRPGPAVAPTEQDGVSLQQDHRHAHRGVSVADLPAAQTPPVQPGRRGLESTPTSSTMVTTIRRLHAPRPVSARALRRPRRRGRRCTPRESATRRRGSARAPPPCG
jgi:hypothetical protein